MKRQKKYTTEAMILKDIDRAKKNQEKIRIKAASVDSAAEFYRTLDTDEGRVDYRKTKDEADRLFKKASRVEARLIKLGRVLSEFRTIPLGEKSGIAGLNENQSVLQSIRQ